MSGFSKQDPYWKRLNTFLDATKNETERGRALVLASLIEEMLEEILRAFLLDIKATSNLFDAANAPLSTLSSKANACRALGLISEGEFRDIDLIRKIRNAFAHNVMCSFEDPKIAAWSRSLKSGMQLLDKESFEGDFRPDEPKTRFGMVSPMLVLSLYNRTHYTRKDRLQERQWPA